MRRPTIRCAIWDVVSWYAGVLQQLWIDVSVRSPHAERYNESAAKLGAVASAGETEKTKRYGTTVRSRSSRRMADSEVRASSCCRDLLTTAVANGQCSPHAIGRWRTQLAAELDTFCERSAPEMLRLPRRDDPLLRLLCSRRISVCTVLVLPEGGPCATLIVIDVTSHSLFICR